MLLFLYSLKSTQMDHQTMCTVFSELNSSIQKIAAHMNMFNLALKQGYDAPSASKGAASSSKGSSAVTPAMAVALKNAVSDASTTVKNMVKNVKPIAPNAPADASRKRTLADVEVTPSSSKKLPDTGKRIQSLKKKIDGLKAQRQKIFDDDDMFEQDHKIKKLDKEITDCEQDMKVLYDTYVKNCLKGNKKVRYTPTGDLIVDGGAVDGGAVGAGAAGLLDMHDEGESEKEHAGEVAGASSSTSESEEEEDVRPNKVAKKEAPSRPYPSKEKAKEEEEEDDISEDEEDEAVLKKDKTSSYTITPTPKKIEKLPTTQVVRKVHPNFQKRDHAL